MDLVAQLALARLLHVVSVVVWIGGVALVTLAVLPAARARGGAEGLALFESVERRFAPVARVAVLLAGASGFWMVELLDGWGRFGSVAFWWLHAMVAIWVLFSVMLFVIEPLARRLGLADRLGGVPDRALVRMETVHRVLLAASLVAVGGAVAGSHGWMPGP